MFKFIKQYAEKINNAEVYPIISLVIFFLFFVALIWYVVKMDKTRVKILSGIPLEDSANEPISQP